MTIGQIVDWVAVKTAKHAGLQDRKGMLGVGFDADIIIFDPESDHEVRSCSALVGA